MSSTTPQRIDHLTPHHERSKANEPTEYDGSTKKKVASEGSRSTLSDELPPISTKPRGAPIGQQSELGARNAEYQEIWEEVMEGIGTTGAPHKKTAVLMISWDKSLDDLDTADEVDELGDVFEKKFRYTVVKERLTADKLPVNQLRKHISVFICDHDSPSTLLILYYAGHGTQGKPGELHFTASSISPQKQNARNSVPWLRLEPSFNDVQGDILLIFDCCHAGSLVNHLETPRGYWPTKSFEFFAACKGDDFTAPPGPKSFTRALIYALEELLKTREKFTTHELQTEIAKAPNFPKHQHAQVLDRGLPCDQRLVLAPLPLVTSNGNLDSTNPDASTTRPKEYFDLRFWYVKKPHADEIREVASIMKKLILDEKILANRIAWSHFGDVNSIESDQSSETVRSIVKKWRLRSSKSPTAGLPNSQFDTSGIHNQGQPRSPPLKISGDSKMSDNHVGHEDDHSKLTVTLEIPKLSEGQSITVSENSDGLSFTSRRNFIGITQFANVAILRDTRWKHSGFLLFVVLLCFYVLQHTQLCPLAGC